jgi:putative membrane protein insertion efficiency factor
MSDEISTKPHRDSSDPALKDLKLNLTNLPRILVILLIIAYQKTISPSLKPNSCCYHPTCSHYGYQAVYKYGALKGSWMAIKRIVRCNPWSKGGYDPVP